MKRNMAKIDGKNILKKRTEKNISQRQLAEVLHVTRQYISDLENGKQTSIPQKTLKTMAEFLDVEEGYFLPTSFSISNSEIEKSCDEIREFISRLFVPSFTARDSDFIFLRDIMQYLNLDSQFIDNSLESIIKMKDEDKKQVLKDLSEGARRSPFNHKLYYDYAHEIGRKVSKINNNNHIRIIETLINSLDRLDEKTLEIINTICISVNDSKCMLRDSSTYSIHDLLWQWFTESVMSEFYNSAHGLIYCKTLDLNEEKRNKFLHHVKTQLPHLERSLIKSLKEEIEKAIASL